VFSVSVQPQTQHAQACAQSGAEIDGRHEMMEDDVAWINARGHIVHM